MAMMLAAVMALKAYSTAITTSQPSCDSIKPSISRAALHASPFVLVGRLRGREEKGVRRMIIPTW